jgi:hypothetical protein
MLTTAIVAELPRLRRLPDARRAAVEAYLREHPEDARRLEAYRRDGEAMPARWPSSPPNIVRFCSF